MPLPTDGVTFVQPAAATAVPAPASIGAATVNVASRAFPSAGAAEVPAHLTSWLNNTCLNDNCTDSGGQLTVFVIGFSMAFDGVNNTLYDMGLFHLYAPYNPARLVTGLLMGAAMAGLVWPVFNMTIWRQAPALAALDRWWHLGMVLLALGLFAAVILLGVDGLLYPVSLLITAGELTVLTTLGMILAAVLLRREGQASSAWNLLPLIVAGLGLAVLLLGTMSAMRYAVLGITLLP